MYPKFTPEFTSYPENKHDLAYRMLHKITELGYTLIQVKTYAMLHPEDKVYKTNSLETLDNLQRELSNIRVNIDLTVYDSYSEPMAYLRIYSLYARSLHMEANDLAYTFRRDLTNR